MKSSPRAEDLLDFFKEFDLAFSNHKKSPPRAEYLLDFLMELDLAFSNHKKSAH